MTTKELLIEARKIVAGGWCQKVAAVNEFNQQVSPTDPTAKRFCMLGSLVAAGASVSDCDCTANYLGGHYDTMMFNDTLGRTQAEVLARFDDAIARCIE